MTERAVSDWMIAHLDPSVGPLFLGLSSHWDTTRPALLAFFTAYVLFFAVIGHGLWRYFRR